MRCSSVIPLRGLSSLSEACRGLKTHSSERVKTMDFDDVPKPFIFKDDMLFEGQFVRVMVNGFTKTYYENLFGEKLKLGEEIDVPVGWLTKGSKEKVKVVCPRCERIRKVRCCDLMNYGHSFCVSCAKQKVYDNMLGQTFGKLTVIRYGMGKPAKGGRVIISTFICSCECGNEVEVRANNLRRGTTTSCRTGECNNFYNHNLTDEQRQKYKEQRKDAESKRLKIFIRHRDKYICWFCNNEGSIVHHLNDFANHPEDRINPDNLVCVCESCHNNFHKWSGGTQALTTVVHNYLYKYCVLKFDKNLDK